MTTPTTTSPPQFGQQPESNRSQPMSSASSLRSLPHSALFDVSEGMSRERSTGQSSTSTLPTPMGDDHRRDMKQGPTTDYFSNHTNTTSASNATPEAIIRRGVLLSRVSPSVNGYGSPPQPQSVVVPTTLHDLGPVSTTPLANYRERRNNRSPRTPSRPARPQHERHQDSPSTPVRRRTTKELINHFEQSAEHPSGRKIGPYDCATPTRQTHLSNARLNDPLPALPTLPLPESQFSESPARSSPIRSLMNLVGLGKKRKGGSREKSASPIPVRRALLAEDDEAERKYEMDPCGTQPVAIETLTSDHPTPKRDIPAFGIDDCADSNALILKSGPLLYLLQPPTFSSSTPSWYNTHAILQARMLALSLPSNRAPSEAEASMSPQFKQLNLRGATVESLPSTIIDPNTVARLQLDVSDSPGVTVYPFEVTMPTGGSPEMRKEMFASTSPWEKGKWVCHIWDAVCAPPNSSKQANVSPDIIQTHGLPGDSDEEDPQTHRLQPPLRVINVSKLSCFFDDTLKTSRRPRHNPTNRVGIGELGVPCDRNSVSDQGRTGAVSASSCLAPSSMIYSATLRSAPLARPHPYDSEEFMSQTQVPLKGRGKSLERRSKSVPCSPSITDLGNLTLVQQRLAKFESVREDMGPVTDDGERGRMKTIVMTNLPKSLARNETQINRMTIGGLTTPPISPQKTSFAISRQSTTATQSTVASFPPPHAYGSTSMSLQPTQESVYSVASPPAQSATSWNTYAIPPNVDTDSSSYNGEDAAPLKRSRAELWKPPKSESGPGRQWSIAIAQRNDPGPGSPRRKPDPDYRPSAIPSLLASELPDIAPLFALIRDTAVEQAETAKALTQRLDTIHGDVLDLRDEKQHVTPNHADVTSGGFANEKHSAGVLEDIQYKLEAIAGAGVQQLQTEIYGLRQNDLPQHLQALSAVRAKVDRLDSVQVALTTLKQSSAADRAIVTQELEGLAGAVRAIDMSTLNERLDGIRASLAVLEAIAQTNRPASAFRNQETASFTAGAPSVDLSDIHTKLDALTSAGGAGMSSDPGVTEKLDALVGMLKDAAAKNAAGEFPSCGTGTESSKDIQSLLSHLREDQVNREQYYKDLNSWLQSNASQTGSQYHSLITQLQQITQSLAPMAPVATDQKDPSSDAAPTANNIFEDIRQALIENNSRNRTNDNFLAAANHLITAANTERQKLVALISSQREDNERLLNGFAEQITQEIRGHKHSFVDAMEKATALNVEGQLRELKNQMSSQLVEMAKGAEQLLDERKVLEHQIAELLTFKERFSALGTRDHGPTSCVSQRQPSQRGPRREEPRSQPQHVQLPQPAYPSWGASPSDRGPTRPLPTPGIPRSGHLYIPQAEQRF
ncbi:hypothetical protein FRB95_000274 [Tulasnella sp. JGI-2019a]|nr:hypothetical protein FRB95_000274 [Tulasnella sp. JGI-2019a]